MRTRFRTMAVFTCICLFFFIVLPAVSSADRPTEAALAFTTSRVSVNHSGAQSDSGKASFNPSLSYALDGYHVAFWSQAPLVAADTNGVNDIYVRTRQLESFKTVRLSVHSNGSQGNGDSYLPAISENGRYVAFWSDSTNLADDDTNTCDTYSVPGSCPDIFVHDRNLSGDGIFDKAGDIKTTRVSVSSAGVQANGMSLYPSVSANGRYVAFVSFAGNLVTGDGNGQPDIFIYDMYSPHKVVRVSVSSAGQESNGPSGFTDGYRGIAALSADGRFVAFHSSATNLVAGDSNGKDDVFIHDRDMDQDGIFDEAGAIKTVKLSSASDASEGNNHSYQPALSANGRYVTFTSLAANLVSGDGNNKADIFFCDRDTNANGIFDEFGFSSILRISVSYGGVEGNDTSDNSAVSSDGSFVAFRSLANNLVTNDSNSVSDIFLYDRNSGNISLVSVDSSGTPGNLASGLSPAFGPVDRGTPAISTLGRLIAYHSLATNLVPLDSNNATDVFLFERPVDQPTTTTSSSSTSSTSTTSSSSTSTSTSSSTTSTTTTIIIPITTTSSSSTTSFTTTSTSTSTTTTMPNLGPANQLEFTQIAAGQGYKTYANLYNPNNVSVQIVMRFISPMGQPLTLKVNDVEASALNTVLVPYGSMSIRLEESGDTLKRGWCQVFANWPISGLVVYQYSSGGKAISEATVYPSYRLKKMMVAIPQFGLFNDTGIAIANPNESTVQVSMRLIQANGVVATPTPFVFTLNPGEQMAQFVSQYFSGLSSIPEGMVEITSNQGILATGLLYRFQSPIQGNDIFTAVPVLPVP